MTFEEQLPKCGGGCVDRIHFCEKMFRQLVVGKITSDEFSYNAAIQLLNTCDACMRRYLTALPNATAIHLDTHLEVMLKAEGIMPLVQPFIVDLSCEREMSTKREAIEPNIRRLLRAVQERTSSLR
jgi:hypothetical protein